MNTSKFDVICSAIGFLTIMGICLFFLYLLADAISYIQGAVL